MTDSGRLDSWKEIASYLRRSSRTAQRWARDAGLPVRRVSAHGGAVYAFRSDIDAWWQRRAVGGPPPAPGPIPEPAGAASGRGAVSRGSRGHGTRVQSFLPHDVRLDPESAESHASLAVYFFTLTVIGLLHPAEGMPAARAAAGRALHLDPDNAEALALLAVLLALHDRAWTEAGCLFERALQREPVPPVVRFHYAAWYLSPLQRYEESIAHLRLALVHEPLYLLGRVGIGCDLCGLGRLAQGQAELEHVLGIDAQFGPALGHLGQEYALAGRMADAAALAARAYASIPQHPNAAGFQAGMLAHHGDRRGAEQVLALQSPWSLPRARAKSYLVRGELDAALECIHDASIERDPGIWILFAGTAGVRLRERSGWPRVRDALGVPPPQP